MKYLRTSFEITQFCPGVDIAVVRQSNYHYFSNFSIAS